MGKTEHEIQQRILLKLGSMPDVRVWRNNTGSVKTEDGRFVTFGLKGSADIIGILQGGRFLAIEVKKPGGRVSPDQKKFIDTINAEGGIAFVAYSVDEVIEKLNLGVKLSPLFSQNSENR
jgi:hypothetical protein